MADFKQAIMLIQNIFTLWDLQISYLALCVRPTLEDHNPLVMGVKIAIYESKMG